MEVTRKYLAFYVTTCIVFGATIFVSRSSLVDLHLKVSFVPPKNHELLTVNPSLVSPLKPLVKILNATEKKKEKKKIAFLKTHKCSSTTIQNILFRYAYKHKLNVVLPKKGNLIGYPHGFTQKSIENTDWFQAHVKPDIFCMHTKWSNFSAIQEFMGDNTIYFTILRDPIQTFISMWDYYNLDQMFFKHNLSISEFFNKKNLPPQDVTVPEISLKHVLLHDFGLPLETNEEMIEEKIREIEKTFDLVMIVEHFDASMVLLRNLLNWNFEDLTSLKLNARSESSKSKVSDFTKEKMKEWLKDDYKVYNHFKTKLETNIEDFGALNLSRELAKYHQVQDKIKAKCPIQFVPKSSLPVDDRPFGFGTEAYKILNRDPECQFLGMQELKFTSFLRKQQSNRLKLRK